MTAGNGIAITNGAGSITINVDDADNTKPGKIKLSGDLGGTYLTPTVNSFGGVSTSTMQTINTSVGNATSTLSNNSIVKRDASGNFTAGTITANLTGTASTATNLAGGVAGAITYQSAAGTTTFTAQGTSGQVLKSNGSSAPTWTSLSLTDITSGTISLTSQVTGVLPGANGGTGVNNGSNTITLGGNLITAGGTYTTTLTSSGNTNVTLPLSGTISTLAGTETLTNKTLSSPVLITPNLGTPSALVGTNITGTASALNIGGNATTATTASNLAGGVAGAITYQSAAGTTTFTAAGTAGQVLKSNGSSAPTWTTLNTSVVSGTTTSSTKTTNPSTITADEILNSKLILVSDAGGHTLNLPTAALLAAALPGGTASIGDMITFTIVPVISATVVAADIITIVAGTGGSFITNGANIIYPLISNVTGGNGSSVSLTRVNAPPRLVTIRFTSSSAYIVY